MFPELLRDLRQRRGWTQEALSEHSGVSVRTVRNLEAGRISNPRRVSVELLLGVLDPDGCDARARAMMRTYQPAFGPVRTAAAGITPAASVVVPVRWRGVRPPPNSLVGRDADLAALATVVADNPLTVLTGPGGVGKTRLAQAVAQRLGSDFAEGVVVADLGGIAPESHDATAALAVAIGAVTRLVEDGPPGPRSGEPAGARRLLVVLDNTEHLAQATTLLAEHLLQAWPGAHLVITTRRPPALSAARIWEVAPLPIHDAVDLFGQRLAAVCPTLDLSGEGETVARLCQQLEGMARLIEFAAYRLRTVSIVDLVSGALSPELLCSPDPVGRPHQRSAASSVRWSLDLLDTGHERLLCHLADRASGLGPTFTSEDAELACVGTDLFGEDIVGLLADLVDASLVQVHRGSRYTYRLMAHVRGSVPALLSV